MSIHYDSVVPWGRSFEEYRAMFSLSGEDLKRSILGCGDGPASFNADLTKRGGTVVSLDPIYALTREQLARRIDETCEMVLAQTEANRERFLWDRIVSPEHLGKIRLKAMNRFLEDYDRGKGEGRYVCGELPLIPHSEKIFSLALCSHFLFLYSENLDYGFHERALDSLLDRAGEVRVFPLLDLNGMRSPYVDPLVGRLLSRGCSVTEERVDYEFQKGGDHMLRIVKTPIPPG